MVSVKVWAPRRVKAEPVEHEGEAQREHADRPRSRSARSRGNHVRAAGPPTGSRTSPYAPTPASTPPAGERQTDPDVLPVDEQHGRGEHTGGREPDDSDPAEHRERLAVVRTEHAQRAGAHHDRTRDRKQVGRGRDGAHRAACSMPTRCPRARRRRRIRPRSRASRPVRRGGRPARAAGSAGARGRRGGCAPRARRADEQERCAPPSIARSTARRAPPGAGEPLAQRDERVAITLAKPFGGRGAGWSPRGAGAHSGSKRKSFT